MADSAIKQDEGFFRSLKKTLYEVPLLKVEALFGFMLAFARVLSGLKSGYPAEYIGYHSHRELLVDRCRTCYTIIFLTYLL